VSPSGGDSQLAPARHPAVLAVAEQRSANLQLRIADKITGFAGSMRFVYITFVMIGQNWQAAFQQAKDDHDFQASEQELHLNTELTRRVHQLTSDIHSRVLESPTPRDGDATVSRTNP
jgi:uncharacterized membrane protein